MTDSTTPQDSAAMSPASTGSVEPVAWAAFLNDELEVAFRSQADAFMWAYKRDGIEIVPLYRSLTRTNAERVVRLPALDPSGAPGWNAAIGAVREALADAGVDWDTE